MVYIFSTITFSVLFATFFKPDTIVNNKINAKALTFALFSVILWRITYRDITGDTVYYVYRFRDMFGINLSGALELYKDDRMFLIFTWIFSRVSHSDRVFLMLMGATFLYIFYRFLRKIFDVWQTLILSASYALYPFFYFYAANTVRQGLALVLILFALSYYFKDEKKWAKTLVLLTLAVLFHWSALPFAVIVVLIKKVNWRLRFSLVVWATMALLYIAKLQVKLLSPVAHYIPNLDFYGSTSTSGVNLSGNRLDFFIFSAAFLGIALILYRFIYTDYNYAKIVNVYILFNTIFLLMGFIAYSDRIAAYSWFLVPVIIWMPLFKQKRHKTVYSILAMLVFVVIGVISGIFSSTNTFG